MKSRRLHILTLFFVLLVTAAAVWFVCWSRDVVRSADALEYVPKEAFGSAEAADGLKLTLSAESAAYGSVKWITSGSFSGGKAEFSSKHTLAIGEENWTDLSRSDINSYGVLVRIDLSASRELVALAKEMLKGSVVYDKPYGVSTGETVSKDVVLSDYIDLWPLSIIVQQNDPDHPGFALYPYLYTGGELSAVNDWLTEQFSIPVPKGTRGTLLAVQSSSDSVDVYFSQEAGNLFFGDDQYVAVGRVINETCYIFPARGMYGVTAADPCKVYAVPLVSNAASDVHWQGAYEWKLDTKNTKVIGPQPGFVSFGADITSDNSKLIYVAGNGSVLNAYITDIQSGDVQVLELGPIGSGQTCKVWFKDGYAVADAVGSAYYCVYPGPGGSYSAVSFPQSSAFEKTAEFTEKHESFTTTDVCFDGEKLAVSGYWNDVIKNQVDGKVIKGLSYRGVYVSVYGRDGLRYHEEWEDGLRNSGAYFRTDLQTDPARLKIEWK